MLLENKDLLTSSKQAQSTLANGKEASETVSESKPGLTEPSTSVSGVRTELTARVNSCTSMEMFMMATGLMIKQMAQEFTSMLTAHSTKGSGRTICSTERE